MRWSIYIFAIGTCKCCNLSQEHFPFFFILELYSEGKKKKASAMLLMGDRVRNSMTRRPENGVSALNKQTRMLRSLSYSCSLSLISPYTSPARCLFTLSRWYFSYLTRPKKEEKKRWRRESSERNHHQGSWHTALGHSDENLAVVGWELLNEKFPGGRAEGRILLLLLLLWPLPGWCNIDG